MQSAGWPSPLLHAVSLPGLVPCWQIGVLGNLAVSKILLAVLCTWRSRSIKSYIPSCGELARGEPVEPVEPISPIRCPQISGDIFYRNFIRK